MPNAETVLLIEPDGASWKLRTFLIYHPVNMFVERCHLDPRDPSKCWVRTWRNRDGERDESRQFRVFREEVPPPVEEKENPLYDETNVKIKLGVDKATFERIGKRLGKK